MKKIPASHDDSQDCVDDLVKLGYDEEHAVGIMEFMRAHVMNHALIEALDVLGLRTKFADGDFKAKARIIKRLHDKGLI